MTSEDALDTIQLVANGLGDMAAIGISPAVDAKRLGADLQAHLLAGLAALRAAQGTPGEQGNWTAEAESAGWWSPDTVKRQVKDFNLLCDEIRKLRAAPPVSQGPPPGLEALVAEWRIALREWIAEENDASAKRLGRVEHALLAWTPAVPVAPTETPACRTCWYFLPHDRITLRPHDGAGDCTHVRMRGKMNGLSADFGCKRWASRPAPVAQEPLYPPKFSQDFSDPAVIKWGDLPVGVETPGEEHEAELAALTIPPETSQCAHQLPTTPVIVPHVTRVTLHIRTTGKETP